MDHSNRRKEELAALYEPPRALRVGELRAGTGGNDPQCRGPGSGAVGPCFNNGASASLCSTTGSGASSCDPGSSADIEY